MHICHYNDSERKENNLEICYLIKCLHTPLGETILLIFIVVDAFRTPF
jgi:hypothetical protein